MSQANLISFIYNPANQSSKEIIENFVIRKKEFEKIFGDLKNSEMEFPEQHYIILGQRGYGKTTLLLKIYNEIKNSKNLSEIYCPIIFNEEEYNIRKLERLWEQTADYLSEYSGFESIYTEIVKEEDKKNYEEIAFNLLNETLKKLNKKLILLIDNITDIFKKFSNSEAQRLREILLTNNNIRIIGTSSKALEHNFDYDKPFYEFFKIIELKGLNKEDTITLLLKLSDKYNNEIVKEIIEEKPQRVETLRRITGGVPRTIVLLFEIFADNKEGNSLKDLEVILDRVTPLYKHRMDDLSPPQQEILDTIAMSWDAVNTKYISQKTRMESKVVSAQLKELEKHKIITKINTNTKNHLYQISERFFNIWYLMRYGKKKDKDRVKWLVSFLDSWCDKKELSKRASKHIEMLNNNDVGENFALYMTQALAKTKLNAKRQNLLIEETKKFLEIKSPDLINQLPTSDITLMEQGFKYFDEGKFECSLVKLKIIYNKNIYVKKLIKMLESILDDKNIDGLLNLSIYFLQQNEISKADKYIKIIYDKDIPALVMLLIMQIILATENKNNIILKRLINIIFKIDEDLIYGAFLLLSESNNYKKIDIKYIEDVLDPYIKEKNISITFSLVFLYFIKKVEPLKSLELLEELFINDSISLPHSQVIIFILVLIWNNCIEENTDLIVSIIKNNKQYPELILDYEGNNLNFSLYHILNLLIAKKQYNYVYQLFQNEEYNLKEEYKPIYYALMYFMRDKYSDEYIKMGSELKETVEEIIGEINQMSIDYN